MTNSVEPDRLVERARKAVIDSFTLTHTSRGGVPYLKTKNRRWEDHRRAVLLCEILVDDLSYRNDVYRTGSALFQHFMEEAEIAGKLVHPRPGATLVHKSDIYWLDKDLPVK